MAVFLIALLYHGIRSLDFYQAPFFPGNPAFEFYLGDHKHAHMLVFNAY